MIWWVLGAVVVVSVLYVAWAGNQLAARLPRLRRAERRFNETIAAGQASLAPRLADLQRRVADLQQEADALRAAEAGGKHRA